MKNDDLKKTLERLDDKAKLYDKAAEKYKKATRNVRRTAIASALSFSVLGTFIGAAGIWFGGLFYLFKPTEINKEIDANHDERKDLIVKYGKINVFSSYSIFLQDSNGDYVRLDEFYEKEKEFQKQEKKTIERRVRRELGY